MVGRWIGLALVLAGIVAIGELALHRNRRTRARRADLLARGVDVVGSVTAIRSVRVGTYGGHQWRAVITFELAGAPYRVEEQWWPGDGLPATVGAAIPLRVDPRDPSRVLVNPGHPPSIEADRVWRGFQFLLAALALLAFVMALP
ncbi:MAG: hypothetical protein KGS47_12910 [Chloroflexi bacterium]|nr:hypothetical protein [Chloroflexota bacterium]